MRSVNIDWSDWEGEKLEEIEFTCPFCQEFDGKRPYNQLFEEEKKEVGKEAQEAHESNSDEEYYNDNYNNFNFYCEDCNEGRIEPMMNYAYQINCELNDENKKKALDCGLFLFEHPKDEETYMALTGGGMDLSPNILKAYLEITGFIPTEWVTEFQQNYRANLGEEDHKKIAKACHETLKNEIMHLQEKKKAIHMFLHKNKEMKEKLKEQKEQFDKDLIEASGIKDPLLKGLVSISAVAKANKEIT